MAWKRSASVWLVYTYKGHTYKYINIYIVPSLEMARKRSASVWLVYTYKGYTYIYINIYVVPSLEMARKRSASVWLVRFRIMLCPSRFQSGT